MPVGCSACHVCKLQLMWEISGKVAIFCIHCAPTPLLVSHLDIESQEKKERIRDGGGGDEVANASITLFFLCMHGTWKSGPVLTYAVRSVQTL